MRGEVFRLNAAQGSRGHEQSRSRFAVVAQSDQLPLSTWLVAPTSTSARAASFRPEVAIGGVNGLEQVWADEMLRTVIGT